jgi:hypothetical protein
MAAVSAPGPAAKCCANYVDFVVNGWRGLPAK